MRAGQKLRVMGYGRAGYAVEVAFELCRLVVAAGLALECP
jgi:hypothetical protein